MVGHGYCEAIGVPPHPMMPDPSAKDQSAVVAEVLKAYDRACVEGRTSEARKLARAALIIDPTCFHGRR